MQDARKYLAAVLPPTGLRVVAYRPPEWKSGFKHVFCASDEKVIATTKVLESRGIQSWIAMASYTDREKGRKASNTAEVQSLFMDLDFKNYTAKEAIQTDLMKIAAEVGTPSIVVASGGGLHVYWTLSRTLPTAEWKPLALAFQAKWQALGVRADPVSADAARVLRLPGTHNRKAEYNPPREVTITSFNGATYDPDVLAKKLGAAKPLTIEFDAATVPCALQTDADDLITGTLQERTPKLAPMMHQCRQVQWLWHHQEETGYELWLAMIGLMRHVENGRKAAHAFSSKHPLYDAAEVDRKFDSLTGGPTTCARFRELNPAGCEGCPFNITSPIVLGYEDPESVTPTLTIEEEVVNEAGQAVIVTKEYTPPVDMPKGFIYDGTYTYRTVRDEETGLPRQEMILEGFLCPERLVVHSLGRVRGVDRISTKGEIELYAHFRGQEPMRLTISARALQDKKLLAAELGGTGAMMKKNAGHVLDMLNAMTSDLLGKLRRVNVVKQMGWQEDGAFIVGATAYKPDGSQIHDLPVPPTISTVAHKYAPHGSLDVWKRVAGVYNHVGAEPYQFALCYGAAGVFLPDTHEAGVLLSLYSQAAGRGKTTAGHGALSWWGDPATMKSQSSDTNNGLFRWASLRKNLPLMIDEITSKSAFQVDEIAYDLCQGREKVRLNSDAESKAPLPPWSLPVISTSNSSVRSKLQQVRGDAQGTFARVIEIPMDLMFAREMSYTDRALMRNGFEENYGHAGPIMVAFAQTHHDTCKSMIDTLMEQLDRALDGNSAYRFWVSSCAATLVVATVARHLGLIEYDVARLTAWTVALLRSQMTEANSMLATADDILSQFLSVNVGRVVVLHNRKTPTGPMPIIYPEDVRGSQLVGRADLITNQSLYIARTAFMEFCTDKGFDIMAFERNASESDTGTGEVLLKNNGRTTRQNLGKGTRSASGRPACLEFNVKHPVLREWATGFGGDTAATRNLHAV